MPEHTTDGLDTVRAAAAPTGKPRAHPAPGPHRRLPAKLSGKSRRGEAFAFTPEGFRHLGPSDAPG
jgi:hypothetical protein